MKYRSLPLKIAVVLSGLALLAGAAVAVRDQEAPGGVYALAQVQEGLARRPAAWLGRVVLLRAGLLSLPVPVGDSPTDPSGAVMGYPLLPATEVPGPTAPVGNPHQAPMVAVPRGLLVLVHGGEDPMLAALRRAPLFGGLAPRAQTLDFFAAATYRVRLLAAPTTSMACPRAPCYEAVLLDAAPWPSLRYTNFLH